ncbi:MULTISPECIES: hypothetical protein [unclassified Acinetobacter]|uniref:FitA-like ribbon-helix-helix domain-containing protein n=1 Tax=unclassified Acinetobacter TaxID=196816 RepID=UPI0002CE37DD|nr:hypothetical protein [Acinetobacter sp. CIP-A165]ENU31535.1 hypothetical protein F991_00680 [Acinetobacter sp. CIP-A165]MDR7016497.1 plasmid stability protein [Prolinoborus sp. 3657]
MMANLTIRNVPDSVHRALKMRAAQHGRSAEAEIRSILENAVKSTQAIGLGDQLALLAQSQGLSNADVESLEQTRNVMPAQPLEFL